jgi:hypothetical protein
MAYLFADDHVADDNEQQDDEDSHQYCRIEVDL